MVITGVFGVPGGGLENQNFARNSGTAKVGARYERRTAKVLDEFSGECAVFHDVRIPLEGVNANIDHIVVAGNLALMVDTKAWLKGLYWTFPGSRTFHGIKSASHVDKSLGMAHKAFVRLAQGEGTFTKPLIAVWGSNGDVNVRAVRVDGASVVNAQNLRTVIRKFLNRVTTDQGNQELVEKIKPYVVKS
ncbi:nuclease-related domain-containing protein [Glutamicibacter ardleyensis]|uniref:nuclease-related domain-containing protein n=1 Tax=Glutamicibacter ardleyensis TaxID=225894 RepID=UPI003FD45DA9